MSTLANAPAVHATRYAVSCLPLDHEDAAHLTATVEYRGRNLWAVCRLSECLNADGNWDYERQPSSRDDEWLATHRFPLDAALELAKQVAPSMTVNGWTFRDVLARDARRVSEDLGCSCGTPGITYEGPQEDCPVHGDPAVVGAVSSETTETTR